MVDRLSEDQREDYEEVFEIFDTNNDGSISVSELKNVFYSLSLAHEDREIQKMISKWDKNGNGKLELNEFLTLMAEETRDVDQDAELETSFKVFDLNGDGFIDTMELRHHLTTLGKPMTKQEADDMLREADKNGDGKIDYKEFVQMMSEKRFPDDKQSYNSTHSSRYSKRK